MGSRTIFGLVGVVLLGATWACSASNEQAARGSASSVTEQAFDKDAVLDDKSLRDVAAMSTDAVQKFLDETPWGTASALASYTEGDKSAAEIIVAAAQKYKVNPLALLTRAQMEQGLISKKIASDETIAIAFGCGCPDSPACSDKYRGFENQAMCAAGTLSRSMDRATTSAGTVSGWARYKKSVSQDGIEITPKNAATAALYTYTPWVGEAGGGKKGVGGTALHFQIWIRFAEAIGYASAPVNGDDGSGNVIGSTTSDDAGSPPPSNDDAGASPADPDASGPAAPDPDAGTGASADAGASGSGASGASSDGGAVDPSDGADDDAVLQGNAPPTTNAPPPRSKPGHAATSASPSGGGDLPQASERDLAGTPKSGGCAISGTRGSRGSGHAGDALIFAGAALASVLVARRRRSR